MNKRKLFLIFGIILSALILTACGSSSTTSKSTSSPSKTKTASSAPAAKTTDPTVKTSDPASVALVTKIVADGKKRLLIDTPYPTAPADSASFDFGYINNLYGQPDSTEGQSYSTYSKYNIAFGVGHGNLVYDSRSFSPTIKNITQADVTKVLGTQEHTANLGNNQTMIGYSLNSDLKLEFVFTGDKLDHYNLLCPSATKNSMAPLPDAEGRQW